MNKRRREKTDEHSKKSSPCGPLCAIFLRGVASFPIQTPKRGVRPLWAKLVKGLPSLAQQIPCSVRLRRTKEKQDKEVPSPATTLQASNARSADVFQVHGFGGSNPERKRASGVSVPASTDGCKFPPGVMKKILLSRMTSIAFVARSGAVAPPVPFGSGQGPHPFRGSIPHAKFTPH